MLLFFSFFRILVLTFDFLYLLSPYVILKGFFLPIRSFLLSCFFILLQARFLHPFPVSCAVSRSTLFSPVYMSSVIFLYSLRPCSFYNEFNYSFLARIFCHALSSCRDLLWPFSESAGIFSAVSFICFPQAFTPLPWVTSHVFLPLPSYCLWVTLHFNYCISSFGQFCFHLSVLFNISSSSSA